MCNCELCKRDRGRIADARYAGVSTIQSDRLIEKFHIRYEFALGMVDRISCKRFIIYALVAQW